MARLSAFVLFCVLALSASPAYAQFTLTAGDGAALPGGTVEITVTLDSEAEIYGFSLGVSHDAALLSLTSIAQGDAISSSNGSDGAEFFEVNLAPDGGAGGTVGCVISTDEPIETLAAGSGQVILVLEYEVLATADPGSTSAIEFTDTLGDPPVRTVVSDGTSYVPTLVAGTVTVDTPSVTGLACTLIDLCDCTVSIEWSNPTSYDSISVQRGAIEVASLAGTATTVEIAMAGPGTEEFSVIATRNGRSSVAATCSVECPAEPPAPAAPTGLVCALGAGCEVALTWESTGLNDTLQVEIDGVLALTLDPSDTAASVDLDDDSLHEICLTGTRCDVAFEPVCCEVQCLEVEPTFKRGDADGSGGIGGISDGVYLLRYGFTGGDAPPCFDAADSDDSGGVSAISDALIILRYAFTGGTPPAAPGPTTCGVDPTEDALDCATVAAACL